MFPLSARDVYEHLLEGLGDLVTREGSPSHRLACAYDTQFRKLEDGDLSDLPGRIRSQIEDVMMRLKESFVSMGYEHSWTLEMSEKEVEKTSKDLLTLMGVVAQLVDEDRLWLRFTSQEP